MDLDAVWCPVCSRLVEPKRTVVPVKPPRKPPRSRGGLAQGTGRIKPSAQSRYRVIIDPGPLPLYCSDECRRLDDKLSSVATVDKLSSSATSDSSDSSAASQTTTSSSSSSPPPPSEYASPSVAVLARLYNFPPPPPPPPPPSYDDSEPHHIPLADNGLIMVGRYLQSLVSKPPKPQSGPHRAPPSPSKIIPGWNDGSHAWRSCLYNSSVSPPVPEFKKKTKVSSRLGDASMPLRTKPTSPPDPNALMLEKYAESLGRPQGTISPSADATIVRRERSLLPPGYEGKLLVPDVKLKVRVGTSIPGESVAAKSVSPPRRPAQESRTWSYDNLKTYDLMPMPSTKEKRTQISIVDGKEVRVEVETPKPLKRLFLFPSPVRIP